MAWQCWAQTVLYGKVLSMSSPLLRAIAGSQNRSRGAIVETPEWEPILKSLHEKQRAFVMDDTPGASGLAGRGGGKSVGQAAKYWRRWASNPGRSSVFICLSAERARDILLPGIWILNELTGLGIKEVKGDNCVVWPNGYRLYFRGCKDRTEANKRRGTPWVAAGWDECDSISSSLLEYDIHECVEPRLMDYNGTWFATGTPGPIQSGYWYRLTSGELGYPVHTWDARDNPYIDALQHFMSVLRRMGYDSPQAKAKWPEGVESLEQILGDPKLWHLLPARFVREYLGKWVTDLASLIYRLRPNSFALRPPFSPDFTTIGLDLGGAELEVKENADLDHSAITVCQSASNHPGIWIPYSASFTDLSVQGLAGRVDQLMRTYPDAVVYIDSASAGKLIEQTYRKMGLPVRHAIKGPKLRRIQLLQGAISCGDALFHYEHTLELREEATQLTWNDKNDSHAEKCKDDCWDSALMATMPHLGDYRPEHLPPPEGSAEAQRQRDLEEFERALAEAEARALDQEGL